MQHGSRQRLRDIPGLAHLPLDLRLAEDHRVEPCRHAIQVPHGFAIAPQIAVGAGSAAVTEPLAEQRPDGVRRRVGGVAQVELGAVAGRKQDGAARTGGHHAPQGDRHFVGAVREALPHFQRRGAMVDADDGQRQRHGGLTGSAPTRER